MSGWHLKIIASKYSFKMILWCEQSGERQPRDVRRKDDKRPNRVLLQAKIRSEYYLMPKDAKVLPQKQEIIKK